MRAGLHRLFRFSDLIAMIGISSIIGSLSRKSVRKIVRSIRFEQLEEKKTCNVDSAWFTPSPIDLRAVQVGPQQLQAEYIVKTKPGVVDSVFAADQVLATQGLDVIQGLGMRNLVLARSATSLGELQRNPMLERVEVNHRLSIQSTDPIATWGIEKIVVNPAVRNASTGSGVIVAVLDTGFQMNHLDLVGQFFVNSREIAGNGVDDDGSGFVDDRSGWDFAAGDANPSNEAPHEVHGSHVAGTIGAKTLNGIGVASVAPSVQILPLRFLGPTGSGSLAHAIQGVNYSTRLRQLGNPIVAINASFGGGGYSQSFQDSINAAALAGISFVAAAGNAAANNDSRPSYPASYSNVISVAATTTDDRLASFSNFGQTVTIAAPGQGIVSTVPDGQYASLSGTSMAAPHVAGAVALLRAREPNLTPDQVKQRLTDSADRVGLNVTSGRLNVARMIGVHLIGTPNSLSIVNRFGNQTDVRYSAVLGATSYEIESNVGSSVIGTTRVNGLNARIPTDAARVTGFRVRAYVGSQAGPWSVVRDIVPRSNFSVENRWRTAMDIQIAQPATPLSFRVNYSLDSGRTWRMIQVPGSQRLVRIAGFPAAIDIRIRVDAVFGDETVTGIERIERTRA